MLQTRHYRPVAALDAAKPVSFQVSPTSLLIDSTNPYLKLKAPLEKVEFGPHKFGLQGYPVVTVTGGTETWWEVTLTPEDATELQALIAEAKKAGFA